MHSTEVAGELMRVTAGLRRVVRRRLRAAHPGDPIPESQRELLFVVEAQPGIGVAGAAALLDLAGNSVSTLVNALVERGLLHRAADPTDRRAARLTLTDAAHDRLTSWRTARAAMVGEALHRLPAADRDAIEAALPALGRLLETVRDRELVSR